eukprot:4378041-Pleurochrysis_carterae.AAC.2
MRRHDATAWTLGRWSVMAGIARAAALLNVSGGGALTPRLMQSAMNRATWWMRREGGAATARHVLDGEWYAARLARRSQLEVVTKRRCVG